MKQIQNHGQYNKDISDHTPGKNGSRDSQNADLASNKLHKRVDFSLDSEDERSPRFKQETMLDELGMGIKGDQGFSSSVHN